MGMVVLGCTTPCVAVSSRKSSDLLTVISIVVVPAAVAIASTGIDRVSQAEGSFDTPLILKEKPAIPARPTLDRDFGRVSAGRRRRPWFPGLGPGSGGTRMPYPPNCSVSLLSNRFKSLSV